MMPLTNGDVTTGNSQLAPGQKLIDHRDALEFLQGEYKHQDGLDVRTLLDSKAHGGLTYNDFLVLPGYIGTSTGFPIYLFMLLISFSRLSGLRGCS